MKDNTISETCKLDNFAKEILEVLNEKPEGFSFNELNEEIVSRDFCSRQALVRRLRELVDLGLVEKRRVGKGRTKYVISDLAVCLMNKLKVTEYVLTNFLKFLDVLHEHLVKGTSPEKIAKLAFIDVAYSHQSLAQVGLGQTIEGWPKPLRKIIYRKLLDAQIKLGDEIEEFTRRHNLQHAFREALHKLGKAQEQKRVEPSDHLMDHMKILDEEEKGILLEFFKEMQKTKRSEH